MADQHALALRNRIIGVLLQNARMRRNRSKRDCAAMLGVGTGTITAYEEGRRPISLPELELLSFFLEIPLAHFRSESAHPTAEEPLTAPGELLLLRQRIIGALLRQARLEAGMSQKELAQLLGCSSSRISTYEYGERPIPLAELELLATILEKPLAYFFDQRVGPVGEWQKQQDAYLAFQELPETVRDFIAKPINWSYLEVAMKLAEMPAGALRAIAEGLLEITY